MPWVYLELVGRAYGGCFHCRQWKLIELGLLFCCKDDSNGRGCNLLTLFTVYLSLLRVEAHNCEVGVFGRQVMLAALGNRWEVGD